MKSLSSVLSFAKRKTKSARRRELMVVCVCVLERFRCRMIILMVNNVPTYAA